ncbi:hypothetical protein CMO83_01390 [Candidatus Woesearchaeota archaeon]|jgi:hypothetical protein|nr:hypothetical protein [Candidatus Woesearchaeota archaeon]MDP6647968.1 hypothetical protein [Candidatus Woesearchaeota archaeon]|tara:strand:+ start:6840 stop:7127 length:288 start_codon:yes stop_codon:yes gene_type:complete
MDLRKPMTETEKRVFKEAVIREYRLKHDHGFVIKILEDLSRKLKNLVPFNIAIGLIASGILVYFYGWKTLGYIFLLGIIWVTLITTVVSFFIKSK